MLKKTLLMSTGSTLFFIGLILFPLPVPFGLPVMLIGLSIMFKASNSFKRKAIRLFDKNRYSRQAWKKVKGYRKNQKRFKK
ncbi:MAG: hypothetical protein QM500_06185 [Methylococcales bacterium]